jgi:lysozyme
MSEFRGIDVSHWQGAIDWAKVKAAGIQFAIIKAGGSDAGLLYRSQMGRELSGGKSKWHRCRSILFCRPCLHHGRSRKGRRTEVSCKQLAGKQLEYPVLWMSRQQPANAKAVLQKRRLLSAERWKLLATMLGSTAPPIPASGTGLDDSKLTPFTHWVAQYASKCTYGGAYGIWQYSSTGE